MENIKAPRNMNGFVTILQQIETSEPMWKPLDLWNEQQDDSNVSHSLAI